MNFEVNGPVQLPWGRSLAQGQGELLPGKDYKKGPFICTVR
jgi:hypothetical protein